MNLEQTLRHTRARLGEIVSLLNPNYLNARSTTRTSVGYMATFLERLLPENLRKDSLDSIFNFIPLSANLLTSGQPTELQFNAVQQAGVTTVINLAPHELENSLKNEADIVAKLGMKYIHIPVDFKQPGEAQFSEFCQALAQAGEQKVLVHCAANMRVSAFMYRYRTEVLGLDRALAQQDLEKIWQPFGVWTTFTGLQTSQPVA